MPEVRLIDANALLNDLKESAKAAKEWREETQDEEIKIRAEQAFGTFIECALRVKNAPTIEPEVRHGRWVHKENCGEAYSVCSECGAMMNLPWYWYCGKCGAQMYGGAEDAGTD